MDTIQVRMKSVYGEDKMYFAPSDSRGELLAESIQGLTGRKTITPSDKRMLETIGFKFQEIL